MLLFSSFFNYFTGNLDNLDITIILNYNNPSIDNIDNSRSYRWNSYFIATFFLYYDYIWLYHTNFNVQDFCFLLKFNKEYPHYSYPFLGLLYTYKCLCIESNLPWAYGQWREIQSLMDYSPVIKILGSFPNVIMNMYFVNYKCVSLNLNSEIPSSVKEAMIAFLKVHSDRNIYGCDVLDLFRWMESYGAFNGKVYKGFGLYPGIDVLYVLEWMRLDRNLTIDVIIELSSIDNSNPTRKLVRKMLRTMSATNVLKGSSRRNCLGLGTCSLRGWSRNGEASLCFDLTLL